MNPITSGTENPFEIPQPEIQAVTQPSQPNWIAQQVTKIKDLFISLIIIGIVILVIGVAVWVFNAVVSGIGNSGKFEGQTAEEWFYDYDWLTGCVENNPRTAAEN